MKLLIIFFISISALAHQSVMTKIETLNVTEAYAPMVFHAGFLWLGRADHSQKKARYRIDIRTPDGETLLGTQSIPHSVERLYPFDQKSIVIMGKSFESSSGWHTFYSIVSACCGPITVKTNPLPAQYQVEEFAQVSNRVFFTEVGDRALIEANKNGIQAWNLQISGPGKMQSFGNSLFVLERNSFYLGDENIVRVNLSDMTVHRLFPQTKNGITALLALSDGKTLAFNEVRSQSVFLMNVEKPSEAPQVISVKGSYPRALGQWKNCLVIASENPHKISFVDLRKTPRVLGEEDLNAYQADLPNIRNLTINPETAAVFLRSASVPEMGSDREEQNSVYRFTSSFWTSQCE